MRGRHLLTRWRFWVKVLLSLCIAVGFGYWVQSQGIALLPTAEQLRIVGRNWWGPVGFLGFLAVVHVLRAYRWLYLLRPLSKEPMSVGMVLAIAFAGFMAIMVMPLRSGELARPYLISTRGQVSMSAAFGTIAVERVIDGLVLSGLLTLSLFLLTHGREAPDWASYAGVLTLGIFVAATVVLALLLWKGERALEMLVAAGSRIWPSAADKVGHVLKEFLTGLAALPDRRHLLPFVAMTLAYWGVNGVGMWYLARTCGLPIPLIGGFAIMTILGVGILIPTGPGHFGNFQAAVTAALGLLGLSASQFEGPGSAYVFILYLGIFGTTVGAGLVALLTDHVTLARVVAPTEVALSPSSSDEGRDAA